MQDAALAAVAGLLIFWLGLDLVRGKTTFRRTTFTRSDDPLTYWSGIALLAMLVSACLAALSQRWS